MKPEREFTIGALLSVTTGIMLCLWEELSDLLTFLAQENLFVHQFPRVIEEAKPWLLECFPFLGNYSADMFTVETLSAILKACEEEHGETLRIAPMPDGYHRVVHPVEEALMTGKKVIGLDQHERLQ